MLNANLLSEIQKIFSDRTYKGTSEIEQLLDIYVPDFELRGDKPFAVVLNNPIYLFDGLPFAKILLPKPFLALEHAQQVSVLSKAIEEAFTLLRASGLE